ncbi:MAG: type II secretion system protein [Acidobacteria bacterium]|nr:type II secretion system protein [Acidobacteriota bacterium]
MLKKDRTNSGKGEEGFMLLGAVVLVFLVLLALSIAAPRVARDLRRDKEVEAIHRGNEYVQAIRRYYLKNGHYPGNMEQLEKSNNIRFLRQKYVDPLTGKADWRLIHQNEAKTTVKGFFGQPLAGLPGSSGGLGSAASMVSSGQGGAATVSSPAGSTGLGSSGPGSSGPGSSSNSGGFSLSSGMSSSPSTVSGTGSSSATGSSSSSGVSSQSATSFTGGGAPIVGVGTSRTGDSITILNEQTTYQTWEFLYDPRIEQMKAKAALLGGAQNSGFGSSSGSGFGSGTSTPGATSPLGGAPTTPSPTTPSTTPR